MAGLLRIATPPLGNDVRTELLARAAVSEVPARSPIPGDRRTSVATVLDGLARVFLWAAPRQVTLEYAGPGGFIGLTGVLAHRDVIGAEAVIRSTVATMSVEHVRATLSSHPETAWPMAEWAAASAVDLMSNLVDGLHGSVRQRVCRHLLELATIGPDGRTVAPVTHHYLAGAVGTAREVATRTLHELGEMGLVATGPGMIVLLDPEGLAELVSGHRGS